VATLKGNRLKQREWGDPYAGFDTYSRMRIGYPLPRFDEPPNSQMARTGTVFSMPRRIAGFTGTGAESVLLKPSESITVKLSRLRNAADFDFEVSLRSILARYGLHAEARGRNELVLTNRGPHEFPLEQGMELGRNLPHEKNRVPLTRQEVLKLVRPKWSSSGWYSFPKSAKVLPDGRVELYLVNATVPLHTRAGGPIDPDYLRELFANPVARTKFSFGFPMRLPEQPKVAPGEFALGIVTPLRIPRDVFAVISDKITCIAGRKIKTGPALFSSSRGIDPAYRGPLYVEAFLPPGEKAPVRLHKITLTLYKATPEMIRKRRVNTERLHDEAAVQGLVNWSTAAEMAGFRKWYKKEIRAGRLFDWG